MMNRLYSNIESLIFNVFYINWANQRAKAKSLAHYASKISFKWNNHKWIIQFDNSLIQLK